MKQERNGEWMSIIQQNFSCTGKRNWKFPKEIWSIHSTLSQNFELDIKESELARTFKTRRPHV